MSNPILKAKDISITFGALKAVTDFNLEIKENELVGLIGPNGAGKTTLMKILATLINMDEGSISFDGINWNNKNEVKEIIGYLPQEFSLYKDVTLYDVLYYIGNLKGLKKAELSAEVQRVLSITKLENEKTKKIKQLSGGMLRRAGIAQALLGKPKILIIDEPTVGLDPERRIEFRNLINELADDITLVISTHIVEDIESTCNNICILDNGNVIFVGTINELKSLANGKIYEEILSKESFSKLNNKISIINIKYINDKVLVRFIASEIFDEFEFSPISSEPTLEDSYFYLRNIKRYEQ